MIVSIRNWLAIATLVLTVGCSAPDAQRQSVEALPAQTSALPSAALTPNAAANTEVSRNIADLTAGILALGPGIDPEEAARAARISYSYTAQLRQEYQITDAAIIHNIKVNNGTKPRGLCWHWAEDIENRLKAEDFQTLDLHRAIANYDNWRLEHSTAIVSAKGASMYDGMVLDPWRDGGELTWKTVRDDKRYKWTPRQEVFDWKRERGLLTVRYVQAAGG
ncbi:hypothetical protein [uncultured Litoreibacter sp.]|uniref:hypothetical protein n=1 Tax=uncultured Litoreibacter sp. TaxID=1392394 RepID=UPI002602B4F1|nr:hypothetical protein [uncultured Litoreibacter sp.]